MSRRTRNTIIGLLFVVLVIAAAVFLVDSDPVTVPGSDIDMLTDMELVRLEEWFKSCPLNKAS
jgi:hypothetical protein